MRAARLWRTFEQHQFALRAVKDAAEAAATLPADDAVRREHAFLRVELLTAAGFDGSLPDAFADAAAMVNDADGRVRLDALAAEAEALFGTDPRGRRDEPDA